jgi:sodium/bile acid cotransporter 7
MTRLLNLLPDRFVLCILATVATASLLPCRGVAATFFNALAHLAVCLVFFLYGARLSRQAILAGVRHWRLHLLVLLSTFALFPLLGLLFKPLLQPLLTPALYTGILFLCILPSTVQASVVCTSIAKGNVSAAICCASLSSLLGVFITPVLADMLITLHTGNTGISAHTISRIVLQLMVPFIVGQLAYPLIGNWVVRHHSTVRYADQGSILIMVYTAFSAAVNQGIWHKTPLLSLVSTFIVCILLLATVLCITGWVSKRLGFGWTDRIAIMFCGSKKSLISGVAMAKILFSGHTVGAIILPLLLFHQIQLMTCAALAQNWKKRTASEYVPA